MLPHELWELIIDELSSDRPALRACGLTQWAWVLPTRRHLYRELSLWRASVYGQKPFRPILSRSRAIGTGIAGCVRAVSLVGVHLYLGATAEDGDMGNTDIPALETILSELPNVARLRLIEVDFKASQGCLHLMTQVLTTPFSRCSPYRGSRCCHLRSAN
ncbi:uncharacterized protein B0H18DRAFT_38795 [Fomitopsis serialis]|uniref:uncharacterized protein n=1 Tax=Fomitopsis serialis TaxID=139415 RepID=UPI002008A30C|nr:uncharacterized protein B0H18DRAFT_38795 [Neoantrodia serialis]KAH9917333.1 hypothetical protein B0H18DRAFT_38795 [Neoantrodia serialis]